jgi:hypothetical protein
MDFWVGSKMRRIGLALVLAVLVFAATNARAAVYTVNLNNVAPSGGVGAPCYCGSGPEYTFSGNPGDQFNFGSVTINWNQAPYHGDPSLYNQDWPWPGYNAFIQSQLLVSYDLSVPLQNDDYDYNFALCPIGGPCTLSPTVYSLSFTLGSSGTIEFGWETAYTYTPPVLTADVPEPSTWAMMILGFIGIAFASYRKSHARQLHYGTLAT